MPHYKNGQEAKVGDRVRGRGYNIKAEIEGLVLKVVPGATSCNLAIGVVAASWDGLEDKGFAEHITTEFGQADAFDPAPPAPAEGS